MRCLSLSIMSDASLLVDYSRALYLTSQRRAPFGGDALLQGTQQAEGLTWCEFKVGLFGQFHFWHGDRVIVFLVRVLDDHIALPFYGNAVTDDLAVKALLGFVAINVDPSAWC